MSESTGIQTRNEVTKLEVKEATEIAEYYGAPQSLVSMYWCNFAGAAYPKIAFLLDRAHKKGIQSIDYKITKVSEDSYECECKIYPSITSRMMEAISKIPDVKERSEYWNYLTKPTTGTGKASKQNVRMSTMHQWLPEMALKRALARACRFYSGIGTTAYEELEDAVISKEDAEETKAALKKAKPVGNNSSILTLDQ